MTIAFKSIVKCEILGLDESFQCTRLTMFFYKECTYVTIDERVCKNLRFISIKSTHLGM
jgi:hypothetical protein